MTTRAVVAALALVIGASAPAAPAAEAEPLEGEIVQARIVGRVPARQLVVRLRVNEHASAVVRLLRAGRVVATASTPHAGPGSSVVRLRLPRTVRRGEHVVEVLLRGETSALVLRKSLRL